MPLIYCLVARGSAIISECAHPHITGNFVDVCKRVFRKVRSKKHAKKITYMKEGHTFNFLVRNDTTFMCMCDEAYGRNMPFTFLNDIADQFFKKYASSDDNLDDNEKLEDGLAMTEIKGDFLSILSEKMKQYSNSDNDPIVKIEQQVEAVTTTMHQNLDKVIERSDLISNLVNKTDNLALSATSFKKKSNKLRSSLCIASVKYQAALILIILIIFYFIGASYCGLRFDTCM